MILLLLNDEKRDPVELSTWEQRFYCIHSKQVKMIECIETMTATASKSSVCGEQNDLMKIAMITTSLKYKLENLCKPGQSEILGCIHI